MLLLALPLALAAAPSPCPAGQTVVMSCRAEKRILALCADGAKKPQFLQYRIGPADVVATAPTLVVPTDVKAGFAPFTFHKDMLATGESVTLDFDNGDMHYQLWTKEGPDGGGGVVMTQGNKVFLRTTCTGPVEERWSVIEPHVFNPAALDQLSADLDALVKDLDGPSSSPPTKTTATTKTKATPTPAKDPIAGKSMKAICADDALLLGKFLWEDLSMDNAFSTNCCQKGVLDGDERCAGDWPSSDVNADCNGLARWRDDVIARFGSAPDNAAARSNIDVMTRMDCTEKAQARESTCAQAGTRWSQDLQRRAGGKVDGQQQSDLATALKVSCREERWSEELASCFAGGKDQACVAQMSFRQRRAARLAVLGVTTDVVP
jgi:hypothetical protein